MNLDDGIVPMPEVGSVPEVPGADVEAAPVVPESEATDFMNLTAKAVEEEPAPAVEPEPAVEPTSEPMPYVEEEVHEDTDDLLESLRKANDEKEALNGQIRDELDRQDRLDAEYAELVKAVHGRTM